MARLGPQPRKDVGLFGMKEFVGEDSDNTRPKFRFWVKRPIKRPMPT